MDYFGDKYTDVGQLGVVEYRTTFPSISDAPIEVPERERSYKKDDIVQQDIVEGVNKSITSKDEDGNTRLLLGYKEDAF